MDIENFRNVSSKITSCQVTKQYGNERTLIELLFEAMQFFSQQLFNISWMWLFLIVGGLTVQDSIIHISDLRV